jgi:hypothetical protein
VERSDKIKDELSGEAGLRAEPPACKCRRIYRAKVSLAVWSEATKLKTSLAAKPTGALSRLLADAGESTELENRWRCGAKRQN